MTGQSAQRGFAGLHSRAPRSISACVQASGRSVGTTASASACISPGRERLRPAGRDPPSTRRTFVSTAPTGTRNAIAATARAVYGPTPGSASRPSTVDGTTPPCSSTIACAARCRLRARRL